MNISVTPKRRFFLFLCSSIVSPSGLPSQPTKHWSASCHSFVSSRTSYQWNHTLVVFCVWFLVRFIHGVLCVSTLFLCIARHGCITVWWPSHISVICMCGFCTDSQSCPFLKNHYLSMSLWLSGCLGSWVSSLVAQRHPGSFIKTYWKQGTSLASNG